MLLTLPAGLPNIIGTFRAGASTLIASGAFKGEKAGTHDPQGSGRQTYDFQFDASLCSAIYGNSNTVTPPSFSLLPQIKF